MGYTFILENFLTRSHLLLLIAAALTVAVRAETRLGDATALPARLAPRAFSYDSNNETSRYNSSSNIFRRQNLDCRGLRAYCPLGFGCCDTGYCAPSDAVCCSSGYYCLAGEQCCGNGYCAPADAECCSDGTYCNPPNLCWKYRLSGLVTCRNPFGVDDFDESESEEEDVEELEDPADPAITDPPSPPPADEDVDTSAIEDEATVVAALSTYYYTITWWYFSYYYELNLFRETSTLASEEITGSTTLIISASNEALADIAFVESSEALDLTTPFEATTALAASAANEGPTLTSANLDSFPTSSSNEEDDISDSSSSAASSSSFFLLHQESFFVNVAFMVLLCGPGIAMILR